MAGLFSLWNSNGMGCDAVAMLLVEVVKCWVLWCWFGYVCVVMCRHFGCVCDGCCGKGVVIVV